MHIVSPTLADILSDDRILRFYQCVKDIKLQQSPQQTSAMFFALCHALGDSVSFLKVPNMNKIMFRQDEQIFAVNVAGTSATQSFNDTSQQQQQSPNVNMDTTISTAEQPAPHSSSIFLPQMTPSSDTLTTTTSATDNSAASAPYHHDHHQQQPQNTNCNSHATSNTLAAAAAAAANFFSVSDQSQHLIQAALSSVGTHGTGAPAVHNAVVPPTASNTTSGVKRRGNAEKRSKKPSPRDKEYAIRRNDIIQDLLKVPEADLFHQANTVDSDVKLIIQGQERNTKLGLLSPLHRFATFANLAAHYDSDFAPKNAGVYYNYEYFQLYLAYRDLEIERTLQQQQQQQQHGQHQPSSSTDASTASPTAVSRPVMMQCRADIEKVLVNTNWEAIRRRLTIGERICQVCGILGRGFLLLSKQVSGRKLLHNFNTGEWGEFLHEFQRPETQPLLQTLQTKFSPERLYQHQHQQHPVYSQAMSTSAAAAAAAAAMKVLPLLSQPQQSIEDTSTHMTSPLENRGSETDTATENISTPSATAVKTSRQAPVVIPHTADLQPSSQALSSATPLDTNVDSTTTTSSSSKSLTSTLPTDHEYIKSETTNTVSSSENTIEEQNQQHNENDVTADGPLDEEESRHKKPKLDEQ
ncbi:unnamed protein product [Absidia cylindrospora]